MSQTILVVDDKISAQRLVSEYLTEQGYDVVTADNGRDALFVVRQERPDLILLDIMMPEMDGYEFMKTFRREHDTPIILLTAKIEETDKVIGLELGADDYVTKPYSMRELLARIRAVMRRVNRDSRDDDILQVGDIVLNKTTFTVKVNGESVTLTRTEFEILNILMETPGRVFSRGELLEYLDAYDGSERTIDVHIRNLRTKIEQDPKNPLYIETVFGMGYRCAQ
ncbi:MAG: response regulator transcription factor [Chloroflexi bacterium]|nr:response regulator transcription factor [Chloroflexota bacterium]